MYGIEFSRDLTPQFMYLRVYGVQLRLIRTSLQELLHLLGRLVRVGA